MELLLPCFDDDMFMVFDETTSGAIWCVLIEDELAILCFRSGFGFVGDARGGEVLAQALSRGC